MCLSVLLAVSPEWSRRFPTVDPIDTQNRDRGDTEIGFVYLSVMLAVSPEGSRRFPTVDPTDTQSQNPLGDRPGGYPRGSEGGNSRKFIKRILCVCL